MTTSAIQNLPACCCTRPASTTTKDRLFHLLEKISALALGILSAYANAQLFFPFCALGIAVGFYQTQADEAATKNTACSQGFMEQLTGVKLPPLISLGVNLAITWCHIEHHTSVFVPVIGLTLGAATGQTIGKYFRHL